MTSGGRPTAGRSSAVAAVFFLNGAVLGNWAPRIPALRDALSLDASTLGLALAGTGTGGLIATPLAAFGIRRYGSRAVVLVSATLLCAAFVLPALAHTWWALALGLAVLGAADAVLDVAMNAQGVIVEKRRGRSLMNRFHAAWSAGAVTGGLTGAAAAGVGLPVLTHFSIVGAVLLIVALIAVRSLVPDHVGATEAPRQGARLPRSAPLALLGVLVLLAALVEDVPQSWGAIYSTELGAGPGIAGLAVVAFSSAMFLGRLVGDALVDRFGRHRVLTGGAVLIAAAFVPAPIVTSPIVAAMLFAVAGFGSAPIFPAAFAMAGRLPGIAAGTALTVVSLVARIGVLAAPVTFGTVAQHTGFGWALWSMVVVGTAIAVLTLVLHRALAGTTGTRSPGTENQAGTRSSA
ncbi:MAG: MFS transporter [Rhodococcus sp. (in: high G+C Gram-positive bacteria)]